jgi:hypothetical protein
MFIWFIECSAVCWKETCAPHGGVVSRSKRTLTNLFHRPDLRQNAEIFWSFDRGDEFDRQNSCVVRSLNLYWADLQTACFKVLKLTQQNCKYDAVKYVASRIFQLNFACVFSRPFLRLQRGNWSTSIRLTSCFSFAAVADGVLKKNFHLRTHWKHSENLDCGISIIVKKMKSTKRNACISSQYSERIQSRYHDLAGSGRRYTFG